MSVYLDTQVVAWLSAGRLKKLSQDARRALDAPDLTISPMVVLELEYLHEVRRIIRPALAVVEQLQKQMGIIVSDVPFPTIAQAAIYEVWTRDAFDRIIVAHARSDGYSSLISSDEEIQQNYSRTIW